jgi:hypothetical protein
MADFTGRVTETAPMMGQMFPRTVRDLGALISLDDAGAGTTNSDDQVNTSSRGVRVVVDLTKNSGTIDVVVKIFTKDKASGEYIERLASASLTATGVTEYIVHPDLTAAANSIAKNFIGEEWKVQVVSAAGVDPSFDLTVGACLLP